MLGAGNFDFVGQLLAFRVPLEVDQVGQQVLGLLLEQSLRLCLFLPHPHLLVSLLVLAASVVVHLSQQVVAALQLLLSFSLSVLEFGLARRPYLGQKNLPVRLAVFLRQYRFLSCAVTTECELNRHVQHIQKACELKKIHKTSD